MKIQNNILVFLLIIICSSCEEVVKVDLQESIPKLVVEASIIWEKGSSGNIQIIHLTNTSPYFNSEISPAQDALVEIRSSNGEIYKFTEEGPGVYINTNFSPILNEEYQLTILYDNQVYHATERMTPVVNIEEVDQTPNGGFGGNDIELKAYYMDPVETSNYYLFKFIFENLSIQIYNDEFTNGNNTFAYYSDEDLRVGDTVNFEIQGISKRFYEYLYILSSQAGENNGGPFQTQPTTVRGNIINETDPENFAFGYFRLSQSNKFDYTIR
jgi:hypothetical protein